MARQAVILYQVTDYAGLLWDIREERETPHGWNVMFGWLSDVPRGTGAGGPQVVIDENLKNYLDGMRLDPGLIDLPIGNTTVKRLRKVLGHHGYRDRPLWWGSRKADLLTMTLSEFCAKHKCSMGSASQMRKKYNQL